MRAIERGTQPVRTGDWFVPHQFGIGATPASWQGWALLAGYTAALMASALVLPRHPGPFYAIGAALTLAMLLVTARHTPGGLRWRWGDDR